MYESMHAHDDVRLEEEMDDAREESRTQGLRSLGLGLLLGAAIGAGAALLMAPQSGDATRRQLRKGARRLARRSSDAMADWWEEADRTARRKLRRGRKVVEGWRG